MVFKFSLENANINEILNLKIRLQHGLETSTNKIKNDRIKELLQIIIQREGEIAKQLKQSRK